MAKMKEIIMLCSLRIILLLNEILNIFNKKDKINHYIFNIFANYGESENQPK